MYTDLLTRYTRKLGPRGGGGDWDTDSGMTHASDGGGTLCGRGTPDAPRNGGTSDRGWERRRGFNTEITCKNCRRILGLPPLTD